MSAARALLASSLCLLAAGCAGPTAAPPTQRPNILIVVQDGLRYDHTSLSDPALTTTPILTAAASWPGAVELATTWSAATWSAATWSEPSFASILTGALPTTHGYANRHWTLGDELPTLTQVLALYGYDRAAFTSGTVFQPATGDAPPNPLSAGFDPIVSSATWNSIGPRVDDAMAWLDERGASGDEDPFLLLVHGYDTHEPWEAPPVMWDMYDPAYEGLWHSDRVPFHGRMLSRGPDAPEAPDEGELPAPRDLAHLAAEYDATARHADLQLGRLLGHLSRLGLLEEMIVVVLADHGTDLNPFGKDHEPHPPGEALLRVPWLLRLPCPEQDAQRWEGEVSLVDLVPSLLTLLEIPVPAAADGQALWSRPADTPLCDARVVGRSGPLLGFSHGHAAVRAHPWMLEAAPDDGSGAEPVLRDLRSGHQAPADPERVAALLATLPQGWEAMLEGTRGPAVAPVPEDLVEQMRDAGYWPTPDPSTPREGTP